LASPDVHLPSPWRPTDQETARSEGRHSIPGKTTPRKLSLQTTLRFPYSPAYSSRRGKGGIGGQIIENSFDSLSLILVLVSWYTANRPIVGWMTGERPVSRFQERRGGAQS